MQSRKFKPSDTHKRILLQLPSTREGAITTNAVAEAVGMLQGTTGGRLAELAQAGYVGKIPGKKGRGGATRWWRKSAPTAQPFGAAQAAQAGFALIDMVVLLGVIGALLGMAWIAGAIGATGYAWIGGAALVLVSGGVAGAAARRLPAPTQQPVKQIGGALPLVLSHADAERDRREGVADHIIFAEPPRRCYGAHADGPDLMQEIPRLRRDGVPLAPLDAGAARKVPVDRGSVRGDLLIAVAVLGALAWYGCDDPPPALPDLGPIEIGSPLAVTKCEMLAQKISSRDGAHSAGAIAIAQTCYLRLIEYRLRRLVPLDDPGPPPPPPAEAPDTMPRPNAVRKTPLSEPGGGPYVVPNSPGGTGFGGGPDVGRTPPSSSDGGGR